MSEKPSGGSFSGIINQFIPHPSLRCVQFWQGIAEIIARGVLLILFLIMFAASSAAEDEAQDFPGDNDYEDDARNAKAAAGFTIFVGVIAFLYQIVFILCRFLNFVFMTAYRTVVLIVDISFNGVVALLLFATSISLAYHANYFTDRAQEFKDADTADFVVDIFRDLGRSLGVAAFFAFASMFGIIFVFVWMILFLVFKWDLGGGSSSKAEPS